MKSFSIALLAGLVTLAGAVHAGTQVTHRNSEEATQLVALDVSLGEQLLNQTGIDGLLFHYPQMVKSGVRQRIERTGASSQVADSFGTLIDRSFKPDLLTRHVSASLESQFSEAELKTLLDWYGSELGQRIVSAEMTSVSRGEYESLEQVMERLQVQYRGSEREKLFPAFDRATYATQMMVDNATSVQVSMAAALTRLVKGPGMPTFEELRDIIEARKLSLRGPVGQKVYLNYLYTYQDVSNSDLERYIRFARSELGERFFSVLNTAVYEVLNDQAEQLSRPAYAESGRS